MIPAMGTMSSALLTEIRGASKKRKEGSRTVRRGTRGADLRRREARSRLVELSKEEGTRVVERKG